MQLRPKDAAGCKALGFLAVQAPQSLAVPRSTFATAKQNFQN